MKKRTIVAGITALALAASMSACSGSTQSPAEESPTLTIGSPLDVLSFDPSRSEMGHYLSFLQPSYDTLIRLDPDLEFQPMLATEWEYTDETKTELSLTLRDDVKFSDGSAMDAAAVVESLERFRDANGPRSTALASVESVDADGATGVSIRLSEPDPALLWNLSFVAGMITNPAVDDDALNGIPAGTGPYILEESGANRGTSYTFVRNPNYYDTASFPFSEIVVKVLTDPTARLNALKTGEVDAAVVQPAQKQEAESSDLTVLANPGPWQGLFLNDRGGALVPALADVRVRQAINYAIDGDSILKSYALDQGGPYGQIFYPDSAGYDESLNSLYPYDPEKAKELLAEAGYANGFTFQTPATKEYFGDVYPLFQAQLAEVGINVELVNEPASAGITPYLSGEFPVFFFTWGSSEPWVDATLLLDPDSQWNVFKSTDPEIESLREQIAVASDADQPALYKQLAKYVADQAWFVPFYIVDDLYAYDSKINVVAQPQNSVPSIYNFSPAS